MIAMIGISDKEVIRWKAKNFRMDQIKTGEGINLDEARAINELMPYFNRHSVVYDIGSNKGNWSDLVVHNVSKLHLFEPNESLLIYTQVKYDYLNHIVYNNSAVTNYKGSANFMYFLNENNGLSNILNNQKFNYLPARYTIVPCNTIDGYIQNNNVDFIKIDVEGAEWLVFQGAENSLREHKIRFIQFEYGEHWQLLNKSLNDVIDYLGQFGYSVWRYLPEGFRKITSYDDDWALQNFYAFRDFQQDWNTEFIANTKILKNKIRFALHIGAGDGLVAKYICDNLLSKEYDSRLIAVDPVKNDLFLRNTSTKKVQYINKESSQCWNEFFHYRFDLVVIEGDDDFSDGVKSWQVMRDSDSFMLFMRNSDGANRFLKTQEGNFQLIAKDKQILIRRIC